MNGYVAVIASFGFAILFNIRGEKLVAAALIGGIGGIVYDAAVLMHHSVTMSLFIASIVISILSELFARIMKCPVPTFLICALIPLVPGGGMYYTMLEIVQGNVDGAMATGISTIVQACSIVLGCLLVSSVMSVYHQIKHSRKSICQK